MPKKTKTKQKKRSRSNYFNRELSWLEFNQRVLDEAQDAGVPLLERLKFLGITVSNLDEFFMVRVGGLKLLVSENISAADRAGLTPTQQLKAISRRVHQMLENQYAIFNQELKPALENQAIRWLKPGELTHEQVAYLEEMFDQEISVVMSPLAGNSGNRFPLLRNLRLHMAVRLKMRRSGQRAKQRFVILPFAGSQGRIITLPAESGYQFILLEDVVRLFAEKFFPGEEVAETVVFRVSRNADLSARENEAPDFLAEMRDVLAARKKSSCVRLEIEAGTTKGMRSFLEQKLDTSTEDVYEADGPIDLSVCSKIASMEGFDDLKYPSWVGPNPPEYNPQESMFTLLAKRDLLMVHPYESFEPVLKMLEEAAGDPDVLAIKQVLYRTSRNSPVVKLLRRAAENGKNVTAVVEVKARFDEARNIDWATHLEEAGGQVFYGVRGLKTHAKVLLVVRREPRGIVRYVHFGTGNYNEKTAQLYTDVSYMSTNEDLGADASAFFNAVTGYTQPQRFLKLRMAPRGLRNQLVELIAAETERCRQGQAGKIKAKLNSLSHPEVIDALYKASQAGVKIELNVRGICCLRPGVKGLSENIRVVSVIDRFLEHARIIYFHHGGEGSVYISSADWMPRNLDRRVELLVPVESTAERKKLLEVLDTSLSDTEKGRMLQPDGSYKRVKRRGRKGKLRSQHALCLRAADRAARAEKAKQSVLEPHRPATNKPD
ncbi:MAG: polyphosphate kinase 1 [Lentisphaeria bacterium]